MSQLTKFLTYTRRFISGFSVFSHLMSPGFGDIYKFLVHSFTQSPGVSGTLRKFFVSVCTFSQRSRKKNFLFFEIVAFVAHIFSEKCPEKLDTFQKSLRLRQHFVTKPRQVLARFRKKLCPTSSFKQLTLQLL